MFALLCSLAKITLSLLNPTTALIPLILFATIASPAPDLPKTIPIESGSNVTFWAAFEIKSG